MFPVTRMNGQLDNKKLKASFILKVIFILRLDEFISIFELMKQSDIAK